VLIFYLSLFYNFFPHCFYHIFYFRKVINYKALASRLDSIRGKLEIKDWLVNQIIIGSIFKFRFGWLKYFELKVFVTYLHTCILGKFQCMFKLNILICVYIILASVIVTLDAQYIGAFQLLDRWTKPDNKKKGVLGKKKCRHNVDKTPLGLRVFSDIKK